MRERYVLDTSAILAFTDQEEGAEKVEASSTQPGPISASSRLARSA